MSPAQVAGVLSAAAFCLASAAPARDTPVKGLTEPAAVAAIYDTILNADFHLLPPLLSATCDEAPAEVCRVLAAVALWWQINIDPQSRALDGRFITAVDAAIAATETWTLSEPERAEAWFYHGAAYASRLQYRVLREERLSAARDGKRIKQALEHALEIDPELHDAQFGIGMYRYYADVAPAALRFLRWLLLLPGGDREEGLAQMQRAAEAGLVSRWEAAYQLHLAYLWYEKRFTDALTIVRRLQARFPRNPHFWQLEAEIRDVYFSDAEGSLQVSEELARRADEGEVNRPALARTVAQLNMAKQHATLGARERAIDILQRVIEAHPSAPADAMARARAQLRALTK